MIHMARRHLARKGTEKLEPLFESCPICGQALGKGRLTSETWSCSNCGISQKGIKLDSDGVPALGSVVGFGMVALFRWLREQEVGPTRRP